jgi:hypothetical protein
MVASWRRWADDGDMKAHTPTPTECISATRTALGPGYQVALSDRLASLALSKVKRTASDR